MWRRNSISGRAIRSVLADRIIFGNNRFARSLQVAIQYLIHGPREAAFRIETGPAAGMFFSCLTSHKYFFVRGAYESELAAPILSLVRPGSVVFDIGAHIGYWTLVLSRFCGPSGTVFAFEPLPENLVRLHHNLQLNNVENVQVVSAAASDVIG